MEENTSSTSFENQGVNDNSVLIQPEEPLVNESISLPLRRQLSPQDTYSITAAEKTIFFAILGSVGSGKTTLISSIYQMFFTNELESKYMFAGSETLIGFEERAYHLRTSSMEPEVAMKRTAVGAQDILHLRVCCVRNNEKCNLLFHDFSGEDINAINANIDAAKEEFGIVYAAKKIVLLIDGEKLQNTAQRMPAIHRATQILKTFEDSGLLHQRSQIIIVVSKYDLLVNDDGKPKGDFSSRIISHLQSQIPSISERLQLINVAAAPKKSKVLRTGYGIQELLDALLADPQTTRKPSSIKTELHSQFNLLKGRTTCT